MNWIENHREYQNHSKKQKQRSKILLPSEKKRLAHGIRYLPKHTTLLNEHFSFSSEKKASTNDFNRKSSHEVKRTHTLDGNKQK